MRTATVVAASTGTTVVLIVLAAALGVAWLVSLFVVAFDPISTGTKVVWFLALTLLGPFAIPAYFLWRRSRRQAVADS